MATSKGLTAAFQKTTPVDAVSAIIDQVFTNHLNHEKVISSQVATELIANGAILFLPVNALYTPSIKTY